MSTTTESTVTRYTNVTIMMPGIIGTTAIFCRELRVELVDYAQHRDCLKLTWKAPRQRKSRQTVQTVLKHVWIVDGDQRGVNPDTWKPARDSGVPGVRVQEAKYSGCDPRWAEDLGDAIEGSGVRVLMHYYKGA